MKKWAPIIFAGVVVILLRLPTAILKNNVEETIQDKSFQEKLNRQLAEKGDYWAKKQLKSNKDYEIQNKIEQIELSRNTSIGLPFPIDKNATYPISQRNLSKTPPNSKTTTPKNNKYVDPESGFSIDFPAEWVIKGSKISDVIIKAVEKTPDGKLAILSVKKVDIGFDDDMWTTTGPELFEDIKDESPKINYEFLDWGKSIIANNHCIWLKTQFQIGQFPITLSTLYYFIYDKNLYRINFSVDKIPNWYENIEEEVRKAIASISFPDKLKPTKTNKYIDNKLGFSIVFPDDWTIKDAISSDEIAIKAVHKAENGDFATLIIYVWEEDETIDFSSFSGKDFFDLSYSEAGAVLLHFGEKIINGKNSVWFKMKMDMMGTPSYSVTYVISHKNYLYQLYGQTILGDKNWFEKNEPKIISSVETFTLTN